ncbi:hypothetical protein [Vulgatibacter sp.]|uniref:hypothetical protein n=1 Tax=Vulgatibacter sp. TaxID=1971226 RepID=UPI003567BCF0
MRALPAIVALLAAFVATEATAQSAKSSVQVGNLSLVGVPNTAATTDGWTNILATTIHTSQQKDLVMDVSLEAGLFTDTLVSSRKGRSDTSFAEAMIEVRVLVDGLAAMPASVIYARRAQTLMASFGGVLEYCDDENDDGIIDGETECEFSDEQLQLVLDTMGAHSFNFLLDDVGSGSHSIVVQAKITTDSSAQEGAASARAVLGNGSLVVEEVRLVNGASISL